MKISGNEIKVGMIIEHKDDLWSVLKAQHVKPGKGGAFNQLELKSIKKGTKLNERIRSSDNVERVVLDEKKYDVEGDIGLVPINMVKVSKDESKSIIKLLEILEDHEDIQKLYSNFEVS